jgi:outer membrane protein assembly factor BamA
MRFFLIILFLAIFIKDYSQNNIQVNFFGINQKVIKSQSLKQTKQKANEIWIELVLNGYISAYIDSIIEFDSINHNVYIFKGNLYKINKIESNISSQILSDMGLKINVLEGKQFSSSKISNIINRSLVYCNNMGHPFASIDFAKSKYINNVVDLNINLNLGPMITIDKIIISDELLEQKNLIAQIIGIQEGDLFDKQKIEEISVRIKETPYLFEIKNSEYEFINNKANLFIYLKNKSANYISGIAGIQQQDDGKVVITGDARLKFINSLKKGETLMLTWRKMYSESQFLNTNFVFPYILKSSFGILGELEMLKKDTSFFNLQSKLGSTFSFSENAKISMYYKLNRSSLVNINSDANFNSTSLNSIGASFNLDNLDYKYNPRKGIICSGVFQLGNKNVVLQNDTVKQMQLSVDYQIKLSFASFIAIKSRNTIKIGVNFASIMNPYLYENELYRIGGNNILRGFDEESIWTSTYAVGTLEYRYILEQNSNIFAFFDYAWYEKYLTNSYNKDSPYGLGLGLNFETKAGIFSLTYALGSQNNNPILIRTAKIHFGFINYF